MFYPGGQLLAGCSPTGVGVSKLDLRMQPVVPSMQYVIIFPQTEPSCPLFLMEALVFPAAPRNIPKYLKLVLILKPFPLK